MIRYALLFIIVQLSNGLLSPNDLKKFKLCKSYDPKIEECLEKAIEHALEVLEKQPNFPSLQPIYVSNRTTPLGNLINTKVYKTPNNKVQKVRLNIDKQLFSLTFELSNPEFIVRSQMSFNYAILEGINPGTFVDQTVIERDYNVSLTFLGKVVDGYVTITNVTLISQTKKIQVEMKTGNTNVDAMINVFLEQVSPSMFQSMFNSLKGAFESAYGDIANVVFSSFPLNQLLPNS